MKRIIISITNDIARDRRMLRTAHSLVHHGHQVVVIGRKLTAAGRTDVPFATPFINCWFSAGLLFYLEFNIHLFFRLLLTPKDVLLSVDTDTLLANTLVSIIQRKPLVIDMHELFAEVPELMNKPIKKSIWRWIEKIGIRRSAKRYTVSQTIADEYGKQTGGSFDIIRNVPFTSADSSSIQKRSRFTVVYLGVLNMGRGLEELIRTVDELPLIDLMIIGNGDIHDELVKLVDQLRLSERVHFQGWKAPGELHQLLQSAHVGVNLLDGSSQSYFLSMANKYFDYIHAELPIITMDFPEYRTLNSEHNTSLLIPDLETQSIKAALEELSLKGNLYNKLKHNCLPAKQKWNWNIESEKLKSIFDQL